MKNYVQRGETVRVTAPAGGVNSGELVVIGALTGVAVTDADAGQPVEMTTIGVFDLPKTAPSIPAGSVVYVNDGAAPGADVMAADDVALLSSPVPIAIGVAVETAAENAPTVRVLIR